MSDLLCLVAGFVYVEIIQKHFEETRVRQIAGQLETRVCQIEDDVKTSKVAFGCFLVSVDSHRLQVRHVLADSLGAAQVNKAVPQHLQMATTGFALLNEFRDAFQTFPDSRDLLRVARFALQQPDGCRQVPVDGVHVAFHVVGHCC